MTNIFLIIIDMIEHGLLRHDNKVACRDRSNSGHSSRGICSTYILTQIYSRINIVEIRKSKEDEI